MNTEFDPKTMCATCHRKLTVEVGSRRHEEHKATVVMYLCICGTITGVVVMDDPDSNTNYTVKQLTDILGGDA